MPMYIYCFVYSIYVIRSGNDDTSPDNISSVDYTGYMRLFNYKLVFDKIEKDCF